MDRRAIDRQDKLILAAGTSLVSNLRMWAPMKLLAVLGYYLEVFMLIYERIRAML